MAKVSHHGCLVEQSTHAAVKNAVVRLVPTSTGVTAPQPQVTTSTGTFAFADVEDTETWRLVAYHPDGEASDGMEVDLNNGKTASAPAFYQIVVTSKVVNQTAGAIALAVVIILLLGCVWIWLQFADQPPIRKATALLAESAELGRLVPAEDRASEAIGDAIDKVEEALPDMTAPQDVAVALKAARNAVTQMKELHRPPPALEESASEPTEPEAKWTQDERNRFLNLLREVEESVHPIARAEVAERAAEEVPFDWRIGSSITITVLFWGAVGSLVRLAMVIQRYLRFRRFYVRGLYQHVALLFAVPMLTAGFVKLASLATIQSDTAELQLSFSDPQIMAIGAFLLALSPWSLWDRLLGLSAGVAGRKDED